MSAFVPATGREFAPWGWTDAHRRLQVAVVGASGAVGEELLALLLAAGHPVDGLDLLGRRYGKLEIGPERTKLSLRPLETIESALDFPGCDLAFLCTPSEVSRVLGPVLAEAGIRVIDLSSALRMRPDVPLVVPEINGHELASKPRLIANPNCTTAIAAMPLAVIAQLAPLEEVIVVSYQAASGAGAAGLETLSAEAREDAGQPPGANRHKSPFAARLSRNVIPAIAAVDEHGKSGEEQKIEDELRKILGQPQLVVESTTARVPVERCHSVAVHLKVRGELSAERVQAALRSAPGIRLETDPHGPRPLESARTDAVHVGRIRAGSRGKGSLCFFAVGDQIRKGASLNALQIAAALPPER